MTYHGRRGGDNRLEKGANVPKEQGDQADRVVFRTGWRQTLCIGHRDDRHRDPVEATVAAPTKSVLCCQIEKLVPQPQDAVALGLTTRNEAPIRSSTKSTSEPARNGTEAGSTSTTALSRAMTISSSALARSISNLY